MANDIIVIEYQANIKNLENSLGKIEDDLRNVEKASNEAFDEIGEKANDAAKGVDNINKSIKTEIASINTLKKQLDVLTQTRDQSNDPKKIQIYNKHIQDTSDKISKLQKNTGSLKDSLSNIAARLPFAGVIQEINEMGTAILAVGKSATTASVGTTALGTSLTATSTAATITATAMKVLRTALISTGIGALIVALGSLVAYFKSTESGSEALERGLAKVGATVDAVIGRFARLGKGIVQLFSGEFKQAAETFSTSFTGIGDEIANASKQAEDFTRKLQDIEDAEKLLSVTVAKTRLEIEKLNIQARDRTTSEEERLKLLEKADEKERDIVKQQIDLQKQKVAALEEENALKIKTGELDEGNKTDELIAAEIRLIELQGESDKVLEKISIRRNQLLQQREEDAEKERAIRERLNQENVKDLDNQAKLDIQASNKKIKLKEIETDEISKILDAALERDYKKAQEDAEKRKELIQQLQNEIVNITGQALSAIVDIQLEKEIAEIDSEQRKFDKQQDQLVKALEQRKKAGLISEEEFNKEKERLDIQRARKESELKKKQFKAEQDAKIKQIAIDTAVAVIKTYTSYGGFTPPAVVAIAALIASSAIQVAKIRSTPVPEFEKGGKVEYGKLKGASHKNGGIAIEAEGGEYFINKRNTAKYESALDAMNAGYFDKYVNQNYVVPEMRKAEERERSLKRRTANTADNIMKALELNGFGDMSHLERLTKSNKSVNVANLHTLPSAIGKEFSRVIANKNYMK